MNRLVLIGNGFDIAHGLKTSYADFINWYWDKKGMQLLKEHTNELSDELCSIKLIDSHFNWNEFWSIYFIHNERPKVWNGNLLVNFIKKNKDIGLLKYTDNFFEQINKQIETKKWVDIEREYYSQLTIVKHSFEIHRPVNYRSLNIQLEYLSNKLIEYLREETKWDVSLIEDIKEKIYKPVKRREVVVSGKNNSEDFFELKNFMILNFNYTNTPEMYLADNSTVNYIHGKLDDPQSVIFGYGDELDENFKRLKEQNDSECMRHVKSIRYQEHDNYRRMLEFIESAPFQVVIMGHSCGNSDRTLLNTIFEHRNCVSIKPYYYQIDDKTDNYSELTININRNFNDPKLMRDRVVCKDYCEPLVSKK